MSCHTSRFDSTIRDAMTARAGHNFFVSAISRRFTSIGLSLMSSILLSPISFCPLKQIQPYRFTVFMTGSTMVFKPAPPQPCSNALHTWYPEFEGGAEASQNGFGDFIPPQLTERSTIACL